MPCLLEMAFSASIPIGKRFAKRPGHASKKTAPCGMSCVATDLALVVASDENVIRESSLTPALHQTQCGASVFTNKLAEIRKLY
jgi:hypothetical protein